MAKDDSAEKKSDPLHEIRENFKRAEEYWDKDRAAALDDIKFRAGSQWPDSIIAQRERDKRPCLTVDKLSQYVRQIVNDGRQNRPGIDVRPVDGGADIVTAEIFQGLIRHIEDRSGADAAYDTALDNAATCGFGYFRVLTEYAGNKTFDQEIRIKRVRNPLSVLIDPSAQEADCSDMKFAFVIDEMTKDEFEEKYPDKTPADWETADYSKWYGDKVRIAEYWEVKETPRMMYLMKDGNVIDDEQLQQIKDAGVLMEGDIIESRDIPQRKVMRSLVSGSDYLEEPEEWLGKYIPIMTVLGNEVDIEGEVMHSGIIRPAKDPQRLYNYSRSAFAERVALTPKAPWVAAEGQVEDYADDWKSANTENHSVLRYRPVTLGGSQVPPPSRNSPTDIPAGFAQDMQIAEHDIQAAIGMYAASLGAPSNERSGKAITARQKEGDVGTFHYHDNFNRAIRYCGKVLVDLIPKVYSSKRVLRVLGYDGTAESAQINPEQITASQKVGMQMFYNLSVGEYDVTVRAGPSYSTLRQEAAESMEKMVQYNPALMNIVGDLMVKNMDWPGAQEISQRLALALPPEIKDAVAKQKEDKMSPEMQQAVAHFDQIIQQKDQTMERASNTIEALQEEVKRLQEDANNKDKELKLKAIETEIKSYEAETKRMAIDATPEPAVKESGGGAQQNMSEIIQMMAAISKPVHVGVPDADAAAQMVAAAQSLAQAASVMAQPRHKTGRAVRQEDGSYLMESIDGAMLS